MNRSRNQAPIQPTCFSFALALIITALLFITMTPVPAGAAQRVILVPMGFKDKTMLRDLMTHFKDRFGIDMRIAQAIPLDPSSYNSSRQSYDIEKLAPYAQSKTGSLRQGGNIAICITSSELYVNDSEFPYVFSGAIEPDTAVVSTAHMDPTSEGKPANRNLYGTRIRKIIYKTLGRLYWKKPTSKDPGSPMFTPHTLKELDGMPEAKK